MTFEHHTDGGFMIKPAEFKYKTTRNGVHATCKIYNSAGDYLGLLEDDPSHIVAKVKFIDERIKESFLTVAEVQMPDVPKSMVISEYARHITMEAEKAWVASQQK